MREYVLRLGKRRPYIEIGDAYINIELPRVHLLIEFDGDLLWGYVDYHGTKDYRRWCIALDGEGFSRHYHYERVAYHYNDWR